MQSCGLMPMVWFGAYQKMKQILTICVILIGVPLAIQQRSGMETEIIVALIGGSVTLIVSLMELTRRQNNRDHASNAEKLDQVINKIDNVGSRLGSHIEWHAHKDS